MMEELEKRLIDLEEEIESMSQTLAEGFFQIVKVLARVTEMTEKYYDGSHSRFVADKSAQVAREMGMSMEDVIEVRIAGLLHDIGKLNFPETCLYKFSTEMTEKEYSKYIQHPELGLHILEPYEHFRNIGEIIMQHHEKLDGSGFPRKLTRDQIHPAAKIIIVVDYYHNQLFKRSRQRGEVYTGAVQYSSTSTFLDSTRERYNSALNFLTKKSNILYDSKVVDTFIRIVESERKNMGLKSVMRIAANALEPGYIFAEDYITSYGLLIAAKGETITSDSLVALKRFVDSEDLPQKILVVK
jgi:putative nucleotidyltransferase with HDIG domain